jgi:hypothetical protein
MEIGRLLHQNTWEDLLIAAANGTGKGDFKAIAFALSNYYPEEYRSASANALERIGHGGNTQIIIETGVIVAATSRTIGADEKMGVISCGLAREITQTTGQES